MNRPQIQFFTSGFFILLLGLTWMAWDHSKFPRELEISDLPAPIIQSPISEESAVREDAEEDSPISPVTESTPQEPQLHEIEYNPERAFHPRLAQLVTAVEMGTPLEISWGNVSEKIAFRPQVLLAENFQLSVGQENEAHWGIGVYSGIPVQNHTPDLSGVHYTMAIVDGALSGTRTSIDGSMVVFRSVDSEGEVFEGLTLSSESQRFNCHHDPATGQCVIQSRSGSSLPYDWSGATRMSIEPVILEQGGYNPENGKLEKYVQPVPGGDQYEQSLKPMFMLAVLDKSATAGSTTAILQQRTSETLAMIANVASVYENQLGIRLYIQEIILTPSTSAYTDIPSSLEDFGQWCVDERPQNVFRWSSAVKWGAGLTGNTLGIAYVRSIQSPASVALIKTGTGWATLAHEMGHNLGSEHSQGGIMNAFDNGGGNRDFFTLVQPNETSARSIFNYAANRLPGTVLMRHPAEIPFALNDSATTSIGEPVYISVLDNDSPTVPNGGMNQLSIREVSRIHPPHAGKVEVAGHELLFSPSPDYVGTAFFSYSLQGSIGNSGRGWLHKGDVAVVVAQSSPLNTWTLAPGDSISFKGQRTGNVVINTQPPQALVHISVDEPDLIVVRANPDATGSDTFRYQQGGGSFVVRLNYVDAYSQTSNDIIVWNKSMGTVSLNPLTNDALAGYIGVSPLTVSTGIGTTGKESVGIASFNYSYSLVSARLLDSGKGRLATERLVVATDGRPRNVLTGTISFTPDDDARGLASIEYVAEDAAGKRMTNYVSFVLPLADLLSPG
ncbi:MAG: M12 family metallo-peptidase [Verrucomicrobia bacterium]|nr:M12 family metallo-peptidase [Verrucomicrobiota bacterium]